ncbi:MAG: DUF2726 domain-containing protein [Steroidobacteraceae bacterium]
MTSQIGMVGVALLLVVVISLALGLLRFRERFRRRDSLLTRSEVSFLWALEQILAGNERVMAKVRLVDVLEPAGPARTFIRSRRRLRDTYVDFVVCHRDTLAIRYAIELDQRQEDSPARRERDAFLDMAMKSAGITLHRVRARERYRPEDLSLMLGIRSKDAPVRREPTIGPSF